MRQKGMSGELAGYMAEFPPEKWAFSETTLERARQKSKISYSLNAQCKSFFLSNH